MSVATTKGSGASAPSPGGEPINDKNRRVSYIAQDGTLMLCWREARLGPSYQLYAFGQRATRHRAPAVERVIRVCDPSDHAEALAAFDTHRTYEKVREAIVSRPNPIGIAA